MIERKYYSMDNSNAIGRIREHMRVHKMGQYPHELIKEALDMAINALEEQEQRWVPVKERLPENIGLYLVIEKHWLDGSPYIKIAKWNTVDWFTADRKSKEITPRVTHWMLLPKLPKYKI